MRSHGESNLSCKTQTLTGVYLTSVQDHRSKDPFEALSKHGFLVTERLSSNVYPYDPLTTAHITYPLSRKYDLPVDLEGNLSKESTRLLVNLFRLYAPQLNRS